MLAADQVHKSRDKKSKGADPSKPDSFAPLNDHLFKDRLNRFKKATGQALSGPSVKEAKTKATSRNKSNLPEHCNIQRKFTCNSNIPRAYKDTRNDDAAGDGVRGTVYACNEAAEFRRRLQASHHRQRLLATLAYAEQERKEAECGYRLSSNGVLVFTRKPDIYENLDFFDPGTEDGNTGVVLDSDDSADEYKSNAIHEEDEQDDENEDFNIGSNKNPTDASLDTHYEEAYLKTDKCNLCSRNTSNRLPKENESNAEEYSQDSSGSHLKAYYIFDSADMECYDHCLETTNFNTNDYIDNYKVQGNRLQLLTTDNSQNLRITKEDTEKVRNTQENTEKAIYVPDLVTFEKNVNTGASQNENTKANTNDWLESTQGRIEPVGRQQDTRQANESLEDTDNQDNAYILESENMRSIAPSQASETNKNVTCMLECQDKVFISESPKTEDNKEGTFLSGHQNTRSSTESLEYDESTKGTLVLERQDRKSVMEALECQEYSEVACVWNDQPDVVNNTELHTVHQEMKCAFESQEIFKVHQELESGSLSEIYVSDNHKIRCDRESREVCDECLEMRLTHELLVDAKNKQDMESMLLSQGSVTENVITVNGLLSQDDFKEHQEAKCSSAVQVHTVHSLEVMCSSDVQEDSFDNPKVKCQEAKCGSGVQDDGAGNPEVRCEDAKYSSDVQADTFGNPEVKCQEAKYSSDVQADTFDNPEVKCQEAKYISDVQADTFDNPEVKCQEAKYISDVQADTFGNPKVKCQEGKCSSDVQADTFGNPEVKCQEAKYISDVQVDTFGNPKVKCQEGKCSSDVQENNAVDPEAVCLLETCENVTGDNNTVTHIIGMKCMLMPHDDGGEHRRVECVSGKHGDFEDNEDGLPPVHGTQNCLEVYQNVECTSLPIKKVEEKQKEAHHKKGKQETEHPLHEDMELNDDKKMWGEHEQVNHEKPEYSTDRSKNIHRTHEAKFLQKNVIVDDAMNVVSCEQERNIEREECCDDEDASRVSCNDEYDSVFEDNNTSERDLAHQLVFFKETGDRTYTSPYSKFQQCHEDLVKRLVNHSPDSLEYDNQESYNECDHEYGEQTEEDTEEDDYYDVQPGEFATLVSVGKLDGRDIVPSDKVQKENKHVTVQQINSLNLTTAPFENTLEGQLDVKSVYVRHNAMVPSDDHKISSVVEDHEVNAEQDMYISNDGNNDHMQGDISKELGERTALPSSSNTCHSKETLKHQVINKHQPQVRSVSTGTVSDTSVVHDDIYVSDTSVVHGDIHVSDTSVVHGDIHVSDTSVVHGDIHVSDTSVVHGDIHVSDTSVVHGDIQGSAAVYHIENILHSCKVENKHQFDLREQGDNFIDNKNTVNLGFVELKKGENNDQVEIENNGTPISLPNDVKIHDCLNSRTSKSSENSASIVGEASSDNNSPPCSTCDSRNESIKQNLSQTSSRSDCNSRNNSHPISDISNKHKTDVRITPTCNHKTNPSDTDSLLCDPSCDHTHGGISAVQRSKETFAKSSDRYELLCNSMQASESHISVTAYPVDLVNIGQTYLNYTGSFPHDNEYNLEYDSDYNKHYNDMLKQETVDLQDGAANKIPNETLYEKASMTELTTVQEQWRACTNHTNNLEQTSLDSNIINNINNPEHTHLGSNIINNINDPEKTYLSTNIASFSSLKDNNHQQNVENVALKEVPQSQVNAICSSSSTVSKTVTESFTELDFSWSSDCVVASDRTFNEDMKVFDCVNSTANTALCLAPKNVAIEGVNQINTAVMFNTDLNGQRVSEHNKTQAPCHISDVVNITKNGISTSRLCSEQVFINPAVYAQVTCDNGIYKDGMSTVPTRGCHSSEMRQDQEDALLDNENTDDDISVDDIDLLHQRLESAHPIAASGDFTTTKSTNNQETDKRVNELLCVQRKTCETMMQNVLRRAEKSKKLDNTSKTIPRVHAEKKDQCPLFCIVTGSKIEAISKQAPNKTAYRSDTHNTFRGRKPMQQTQKPLVRPNGSRENCQTMPNSSNVNQLHENLNRRHPSKKFERIGSKHATEISQLTNDVNVKQEKSKSMKNLHQCNSKRSMRNLTTGQTVKKSKLEAENNEKQSLITTPGNQENELQYSGKYNNQLPDSKIPRRVKTGTFSGTNRRRGNKNANYSEIHDNVAQPGIGASDMRQSLSQQLHCASIDHENNFLYTNSDHDELIFTDDQSVCRGTLDLGTRARGINCTETRHILLVDNQDFLTQPCDAENELNQDHTAEQYLYQTNAFGEMSADYYVDNDSVMSADANKEVLTHSLTNHVSVNNSHQLLREQFCCRRSRNLKYVPNQDGTNQPQQSFCEIDRSVSVNHSSITQPHQIKCETDRPVSVKQSSNIQPQQIPYETDRSEYVKQCCMAQPHQLLSETDRSVSVQQSSKTITNPIRNEQMTNLSIHSSCCSHIKQIDCHDKQFKHPVKDKQQLWDISEHKECSSVGLHLVENDQGLCWNNQINQLPSMPVKGETVENLANGTSTTDGAREQSSTAMKGNVSLYISNDVSTILNNTDASWDNARCGGKPIDYVSYRTNIITAVNGEQLGECVNNHDMHEVNTDGLVNFDKVSNMRVSKTPASETVTFRNMVKTLMNQDEEFLSDDDVSVFINDGRKRNNLVLPMFPLGSCISKCEKERPPTIIDRDPHQDNTSQRDFTDDHFQKSPCIEAVTCSGEINKPTYAELKARALAKALPVLSNLKLQSRKCIQIETIANHLSCDNLLERTMSESPLIQGNVKATSLIYNSDTGAVFANDYFEEADMSNCGKFTKNETYYNSFTGVNINNSKSDQCIDRDNDSAGGGHDNSGENSIICDVDQMNLEQKATPAVITKDQTKVHRRSNVWERPVHRKCRIPVRQSQRPCVLPEEVEIPYDKHVKQPRNIVMVLKSKNKSKGHVAAALSLVQPADSNISSATDTKHTSKLPKYVQVFTKGRNVVVEVCADASSTADSVSNREQVRAPLAERIKKYQQQRPRNIFAGRNHAREDTTLESASRRLKKTSIDISSCSEVSSIVSNSHVQTCEQASKYVNHEHANKCVNYEQASKSVSRELANKCVNHEQASKSVNREQANKCVNHEQASKSVNREQANKCVNHEQASKSVSRERANKCVNHEQASKSVSRELANKCVNHDQHEQANKCVNHEQTSKYANHEQTIREQANRRVNHEQSSKSDNHEQASRCVDPCIKIEKAIESDTSTPRSSKTFNVSNDEETLFATGREEKLPMKEHAVSQDDVAIQTSDNTLASAVTVEITHLTVQKRDAAEQVSFSSGNKSNSGAEELNANAAVENTSKSLGEKDGSYIESNLKSSENRSILASITKATTSLSASPKRYLKKNVAFRSKPLEIKANAECAKTPRYNSGTCVDKHTVDAVTRRYQGTPEKSTKTETTNIKRQQRYRKQQRPVPVEQTDQHASVDLMSNCQLFSPSSHESNELSSQQGPETALESQKSLCVNKQNIYSHQRNLQSNKVHDQNELKQHTALDNTESGRDGIFLDFEATKTRSLFNHEIGLQNEGCIPSSNSTRIEESKLSDTGASRSVCNRAENSLVKLQNIITGPRAGSSLCELSEPKQFQQTECAVRNQHAVLDNIESACSVKSVHSDISLPDRNNRIVNESMLRLTDSSTPNVKQCAHTENIPDSEPAKKQMMNNDCVSTAVNCQRVSVKKTEAEYDGIQTTQFMNETGNLTGKGSYETLALDRATGEPCNISVTDCASPIEGEAIKSHKLPASNSCHILTEEILVNGSNFATHPCNNGSMLSTFNKRKDSFFNPIPATVSPRTSKKHPKAKSLLLKSIAFTAEDSSTKSSLRSNENGNAYVYAATRRSDSCNPLSVFKNDSSGSPVNDINLTPDICLSGGALPVGNRPSARIEWHTYTSMNQTLQTFENGEHSQVYLPPNDSGVLSRRSSSKNNQTPSLSPSKNNLKLGTCIHPHTSGGSAIQVKMLETLSTSPGIVNEGRFSENLETSYDTQSLSLPIKCNGKQTSTDIKPNNYKHDSKIKASNTQELVPFRKDLHTPHMFNLMPTVGKHNGMTTPRKGKITFTNLEMKDFDEHSPGVINSCESFSYSTTSQESTAETHVNSSRENIIVLAGPFTTSNDAGQISPIQAASAHHRQSSRALEDVLESVKPKLPPLSSRQSGLPHRPHFKRYY